METVKPTLKRGRDVWDKINMPEAEFQNRLGKIKKEMKKEGIDILLLYGNGLEHYGNPCYVSNCITKLPQWGVLIAIPQNDETVLIYRGGSREIPAMKSTTWLEQVRPCSDISQECVTYLKEKNLIPSTIGLVGFRELMPYYQLRFFLESVSQCKIVDFGHIMRDMRAVKSQRECNQIRRSSRIINHVFNHIAVNPPKNMNERVLEAYIDRVARLEGVEDCRILVAKPQEEKWAFRPAEDVPISPGASVIIYLAVEFERYWAEGVRTFVAESTSLTQPKLDNARALYERVTQGMKPGKTLSQFYKEVIGELQKSNIEHITEYGLGQGIGLGLQESPVIAEEEVSQLREGMCLTLRLAIRDKEMGAIMIGNTIHLLKDGPEVLTG